MIKVLLLSLRKPILEPETKISHKKSEDCDKQQTFFISLLKTRINYGNNLTVNGLAKILLIVFEVTCKEISSPYIRKELGRCQLVL